MTYVVFSDASLVDMCSKLPQTAKGFLSVPGAGLTRPEKYGDIFTAVVKEYTNS